MEETLRQNRLKEAEVQFAIMSGANSASMYWQWRYVSGLLEQQVQLGKSILQEIQKLQAEYEDGVSAKQEEKYFLQIELAREDDEVENVEVSYKKVFIKSSVLSYWEEALVLRELVEYQTQQVHKAMFKEAGVSDHPNKKSLPPKQESLSATEYLYTISPRLPLLCQLNESVANKVYVNKFAVSVPSDGNEAQTVVDFDNFYNRVADYPLCSRSVRPRQSTEAYPDEVNVSQSRNREAYIGFYGRIFVTSIMLGIPSLVVLVGVFLATLHVAGAFDPIIYRIEHLSLRWGFDRTRPLSEILRELRARRTFRSQEAAANRNADEVFRSLERRRDAAGGAAEAGGSSAEASSPTQVNRASSEQEALHGRPAAAKEEEPKAANTEGSNQQPSVPQSSERVSSSEQPNNSVLQSISIQRIIYLVRFIYQLFVAFVCSLNPQWEPLYALIVPPEEAGTASGGTAAGGTASGGTASGGTASAGGTAPDPVNENEGSSNAAPPPI